MLKVEKGFFIPLHVRGYIATSKIKRCEIYIASFFMMYMLWAQQKSRSLTDLLILLGLLI